MEQQLYKRNKPILEQVIFAYEAQDLDSEYIYWVAVLMADEHIWSTGETQEQAVGRLWLTYPEKIIEHCKKLGEK